VGFLGLHMPSSCLNIAGVGFAAASDFSACLPYSLDGPKILAPSYPSGVSFIVGWVGLAIAATKK